MYKIKEKDGISYVMDDSDNVIARYTVDYHWVEKNISMKDAQHLNVRLWNGMSYQDCAVKLNNDSVQKIPLKIK